MYRYMIGGLRVVSDIPLPGAIPQPQDLALLDPDVAVVRGNVPDGLDAPSAGSTDWERAGNTFLLRVPGTVRFLITAGASITVQIEPDSSDHDAAGYVLGSAFSILLHQRGLLVLHGAAVARNGEAIVICGESGAGKSTLAAALSRKDCTFITDDVCVIGQISGAPIVLPDGRKLKLWRESIDQLSLEGVRGDAVHRSYEKYFIEPAQARTQATPLAAIYVLQVAASQTQAGFSQLTLPDAMRMIDWQSYRPEFREQIGHRPQLVRQAAELLRHAPMFTYARLRGFETFDASVADLLEHWDGLAR